MQQYQTPLNYHQFLTQINFTMNNSFYKILKLEFKLNFTNWIILLGIFFTILVWLTLNKDSSVIGGSYVPSMILFSSLITLHSYSESTTRQSMEMYHLLPVDGNTKFFSKQLITLIFFPIILLGLYLLFAIVVYPLVFGESQRSFLSPNIEPDKIGLSFIWAHSFATFFAILFKKRKILYAIAAFFVFQIIVMVFMLIWIASFKMTNGTKTPEFGFFTSNSDGTFSTIILIAIPLIFYFISYRLFFRRQL